MLDASLRRQHTHRVSSLIGQPLLNQCGIFEVDRDQNFSRRLAILVVELFDRGADKLLVRCISRLGPEEILSSDQQAAAHKQDLKVYGRTLSG